jgi:hypothetical protein
MSRLTAGERIVLVAGVLLIVDLLLLPWHSISASDVYVPAGYGVGTLRLTAVQAPYAGYGVAAVVLSGAMVLQIVLTRLFGMRLTDPPVPWSQVQLVVGVFVAVVLVIKLVRETDLLGYGAYSGILGGLLVAYGGYMINQESSDFA